MDNAAFYDVLIFGGGQAGIPLAYALAGEGLTVAPRRAQGPWRLMCELRVYPDKGRYRLGQVAHEARRASEFGVEVSGVTVNFPAVLERARSIAEQSRTGIESGFEGSDNPVLLRGHASFEGREEDGFRVRVGDQSVTAKQVVLNTGTRTLVPPIDGLDSIDYIDSGNWLDHTELPEHLAIIGGGYIGLEMSQFYRRMGSRVTVVGGSERVAKTEDEEVSAALQGILEDDGVEFLLNTARREG